MQPVYSSGIVLLCIQLLAGCGGKAPGTSTDGENVTEPGTTPDSMDVDGDGFVEPEDCDDHDPSIHPSAAELCDQVDNDCDGEIDEGVLTVYYADADGDGYGDGASSTEACAPSSGWVDNTLDCDDTNPEIGDISDDADCDGVVGEDDCDDTNPALGSIEHDQDCDGVPTKADCDDTTPALGDISDDADCDGVPSTSDCDDQSDAFGDIADDADCDGTLTQDDCDDTDPAAAAVGSSDSIDCSASGCNAILIDDASAVDGMYWIDPLGEGAYEVYCDMTTDGGGWTLVLNFNGINVTEYDSSLIFEEYQSLGATTDDNHLSRAFYDLSYEESYLIDDVHDIPVASDESFTDGSGNAVIDEMLGGTFMNSYMWSKGSRSYLYLTNALTTDGLLLDGDIRLHICINQSDSADLEFPVTIDYRPSERHLVLNSDYYYAGARIWSHDLYDIETYGADVGFSFFVR